jgi:hypothetical protein
MLDGRDGHYIAKADFAPIQNAVANARLCERSGVARIIETNGMRLASPRVLVELRCAGEVKTYNDTIAADLPGVATTLLSISRALEWHYTGPPQRQTRIRFAF